MNYKKLTLPFLFFILINFSANALELKTSYRHGALGTNEDSSLAPWLPFTEDKVFVIPKDKVVVITQANKNISHYYEVILNKIERQKKDAKPGKITTYVKVK